MHFYGQSYQGLMNTPYKVFWVMHRCLDRIASWNDQRHLNVAASSQSSEAYTSMTEGFTKSLGTTVVIIEDGRDPRSEKLDREGLAALRAMSKISGEQ